MMKELTLDEYQKKAMSTCMASCDNFAYMSYGLIGEAGELFGKIAKHIRKGNIKMDENDINVRYVGSSASLSEQDVAAIVDELGDCLWFVAGIAHAMGYKLSEVGSRNNKKLESRKQRNVIDGDGDNR